MPRTFRRLFPVVAAFAVGCGEVSHVLPGTNPLAADAVARYPVRTDWLVQNIPSVQPPRWNTPGFAPLRSLALAPNTPDMALVDGLRTERDKKNLLDPLAQIEGKDRAEIGAALDRFFGTPTAPAVRVDPSALKTLELDPPVAKQIPAAAAARSALGLDDSALARGAVLYRRWCAQCHGASGAGDGPGAAELQPPPRDYRQGVFKFVAAAPDPSALGKPRRSDLVNTIRRGLDGSAMPAFPQLTPGELDDLAAYVTHLAVRGESEYQTMRRLVKQAEDLGAIEQEVATAMVRALAGWGKAEASPLAVPPENCETDADRLASAAAGHKAYAEFGCAACHANYGRTALLRYDAWGTVVQPRNFVVGVYRAGRRGDDLYARVYYGIAGAGMPGHKEQLEKSPAEPGKPDKVWNLVHFLQAVSDPATRERLAEKHGVVLE